jgi:hypothetical protein
MPVVTVNANRGGFAIGQSSIFSTCRQTSTGVTDGNFSTSNQGLRYLFAAGRGRGGGTHSIARSFFHFDVSSATGVISGAQLLISGNTNTSSDGIVLKSTAFGGDGGTALSTSDYFNSIDYTTAYSAEFTTWSTGTNVITLNSTAESDIQNNNDFIVVLVNHNNDFSNTAASTSTTQQNGINFSSNSNVRLKFTETVSSNITSLNTIARASITSFNTITLASIDEINTIGN